MARTLADSEDSLRRDLAELCWRLYDRGYVVATDGNVSARLPDGRLLITPTGISKADVRQADLVLATARGEPLDPALPGLSSEVRLHVAVYEERPDVRVVCHAHPPTAVAFTLAGCDLAACLLPEVVIGLGKIGVAPYATPTTLEAAEAVRSIVRTCDVVLLDRHGSVTVGRDTREAFHHLERLEWSARVTLAARQLGGMRSLPKEEVERLLEVRARLRGGRRLEPCSLCGACLAD